MLLDQLGADISNYLDAEPNLRRDDRKKYLLTILTKYFTISTMEHIIKKDDLNRIISQAKSEMVSRSVPVYVSERKVEQPHLVHLAIIETLLLHLNSKDLLKQQVSLDYTAPTEQYEY